MRVLFVGFSYVIDVYQTKLAVIASKNDVKVGLLCPSEWKFREWTRKFVLNNIHPAVKYYPVHVSLFNGRQGAFLYPFCDLVKAIREFNPDLIYVEQEVFSLATFQLSIVARFFKVPLVVFCWENIDKKLSIVRRFTTNVVLHLVSFITPGNRDAELLLRKWGYKGSSAVIPQFGVDTELFCSPLVKIPSRTFSIGFVGRLVYEKGVDLILLALAELLKEGLDVQAVICGVGPFQDALIEQANTLGIQDKVIWLGEKKYEEIPLAMAQMDLLILPSRTIPGFWKEQFGHVLIEAMAMKIPVIGSNCGAISEVIGNDDYVFQENNHEELVKIIRKMVLDTEFFNAASLYVYERVQSFTHERLADRLIKIFTEILQKQGRLTNANKM